jgi:hypothetical protein
VRQVDLVQRPVVDLDVHGEARVLHAVAGEALHAGHHVPLRPARERAAQGSEEDGLLAAGLSPTP